MINQIWDTMMTISHLVYNRLHNEQSFEPGSMEKKSLHKFPSFDAIKSNSIDTNLNALREYVLESCTEFNRAHFFMLLQAAILVYYPSIALSIVYQEYQQEIQDQALQDMEEEEMIQSDQDELEQDMMSESKRSDVIQRYVAMKQSQLSQLAEISRFDQQEISQQPLMRIIQLLQRVIAQFMMQPPDKQYVDQYESVQQLQSQCLMQQSSHFQYYQMVQQQQLQNIQNVQSSNYCQQQQQQQQQQERAKKAAQNNENKGVKITVVIKLPGEGRQGQVDEGGVSEKLVVYQSYTITF